MLFLWSRSYLMPIISLLLKPSLRRSFYKTKKLEHSFRTNDRWFNRSFTGNIQRVSKTTGKETSARGALAALDKFPSVDDDDLERATDLLGKSGLRRTAVRMLLKQ